jgi:hypothetical protein
LCQRNTRNQTCSPQKKRRNEYCSSQGQLRDRKYDTQTGGTPRQREKKTLTNGFTNPNALRQVPSRES